MRFGSLAAAMCVSLSFLFCAGFTDRYIIPDSVRPLSRRQECILEHLWEVAQEFLDVEEVPFDFCAIKEDLESRRSSYDGDLVSTRQSIVCELVVTTWPLVGEAAVCPHHRSH